MSDKQIDEAREALELIWREINRTPQAPDSPPWDTLVDAHKELSHALEELRLYRQAFGHPGLCALDQRVPEYLESLPNVTRFEVIDPTGRVYGEHDIQISLSFQDDGRTLKVFVNDRLPSAI